MLRSLILAGAFVARTFAQAPDAQAPNNTTADAAATVAAPSIATPPPPYSIALPYPHIETSVQDGFTSTRASTRSMKIAHIETPVPGGFNDPSFNPTTSAIAVPPIAHIETPEPTSFPNPIVTFPATAHIQKTVPPTFESPVPETPHLEKTAGAGFPSGGVPPRVSSVLAHIETPANPGFSPPTNAPGQPDQNLNAPPSPDPPSQNDPAAPPPPALTITLPPLPSSPDNPAPTSRAYSINPTALPPLGVSMTYILPASGTRSAETLVLAATTDSAGNTMVILQEIGGGAGSLTTSVDAQGVTSVGPVTGVASQGAVATVTVGDGVLPTETGGEGTGTGSSIGVRPSGARETSSGVVGGEADATNGGESAQRTGAASSWRSWRGREGVLGIGIGAWVLMTVI